MSDSVKKWYEMQEDKTTFSKDTRDKLAKIFESPDGGKTVRERPAVDLDSFILSDEEKKKAYQILCDYDKKVILHAARILKSSL